MRIDTELAASADGAGGHVFANDFGGVRYGRALAFDAARRQVAVASERIGDRLRLTVPAEFVAGAKFPLTIDPLVQAVNLGAPNPSTAPNFAPDCAYLGTFEGIYATVYEEVYSGTDHDVYLQPYDRNGNWLPGLYVDYDELLGRAEDREPPRRQPAPGRRHAWAADHGDDDLGAVGRLHELQRHRGAVARWAVRREHLGQRQDP